MAGATELITPGDPPDGAEGGGATATLVAPTVAPSPAAPDAAVGDEAAPPVAPPPGGDEPDGPEGPGGRGRSPEDPGGTHGPPPARRASRYAAALAVPIAVGVALRLGLALGDDVITNDASAYLESGRNLLEGRGFVRGGGRPELHFPPGTPVVLGAAWRLTGSAHLALVGVTFLASCLCLLPLAGLARRVGGDRAGVAACWVGALAPGLAVVPVHAGGGSEGLALLLLLVLLWLVSTLPDRSGAGVWATAAAAGLAGAALYLTRPEGLVLVVAVAAVVALTSGVVGDLRRRRATTRRLVRQLGPAALILVVVAVAAAPYVVFLHGHTGSWELTAKSNDASIEAWRAVADGDRRGRDRVLYELDGEGLGFVERSGSLTALARADRDAYAGIVGTNLSQLWGEYVAPRPDTGSPVPAWVLLPLPLTGVALWAGWRHRRDPSVIALVAVAALATATCLVFFVQSRYLVPAVAVLSILAGVGLAGLRPRWRRPALWAAVALLALPVLVDVPRDEGTFVPREPVEHRLAGEWLAENAAPEDRVMTRSLVVGFYSGRTAVPPPFAPLSETLRFAAHHGVDHLVVDEFLLHRFRPQLTPLLGPGPWPGLDLVHEIRHDGRLTRIFALDPPPATESADPPTLGFVGDG